MSVPHKAPPVGIIAAVMPSERIQRRIDRLLDQAEEAADAHDWPQVTELAREVLTLEPEDADASAMLASAEQMQQGTAARQPPEPDATGDSGTEPATSETSEATYDVRFTAFDGVVLRTQSDHELAESIERLPRGYELRLIELSSDRTMAHVLTLDGRDGWCSAIELANTPPPAAPPPSDRDRAGQARPSLLRREETSRLERVSSGRPSRDPDEADRVTGRASTAPLPAPQAAGPVGPGGGVECPNCHRPVSLGDRFCQWCSTFLIDEHLRLAGVFRRFVATLIDPFVSFGLFGAAILLLGSGALSGRLFDVALAVALIIGTFVGWISLWRAGFSPGKALVGVRVMRTNGERPGLPTMLLREWIGKYISGLFFGIGWFWAIFDRDRQTWHDKMAGTVVVRLAASGDEERSGALRTTFLLIAAAAIAYVWAIAAAGGDDSTGVGGAGSGGSGVPGRTAISGPFPSTAGQPPSPTQPREAAAVTRSLSGVPVIITGQGASVAVVSGPRAVTVVVSGPAGVVNRASAGSVQMEVDISGLGPGTHSLRVLSRSLTSDVTVVDVTPRDVVVRLGLVIERSFPVTLRVSGSPPYGFYMADAQLSVRSVVLRGLEDAVDTVRSVVAVVEVENARQDVSIRGVPLQLEPGGASTIRVIPASVNVVLPIRRLWEIQLVAPTRSSGGCPFTTSTAPSISVSGRFVVFSSGEVRFVDLDTGRTESIAESGVRAVVSDDGRYIAFGSDGRLTADDTDDLWDVFLHDRVSGDVLRLTQDAHQSAWSPAITADGRFIAFEQMFGARGGGFTTGVFVYDRLTGETERIDRSLDGSELLGHSNRPALSGDGRFVAFQSSGLLVPDDSNRANDVFVHDRQTGSTVRISVSSGGEEADKGTGSGGRKGGVSISSDGRFVAYVSRSTNLVPSDTNDTWDVFVHDRQDGSVERVSVASDGSEANGISVHPALSSDGRFVVFESDASNLAPGDENSATDIFVHDRVTGETRRVSIPLEGRGDRAQYPSISADGGTIVFASSLGRGMMPTGGGCAFLATDTASR